MEYVCDELASSIPCHPKRNAMIYMVLIVRSIDYLKNLCVQLEIKLVFF
jgi:hypothetical protein